MAYGRGISPLGSSKVSRDCAFGRSPRQQKRESSLNCTPCLILVVLRSRKGVAVPSTCTCVSGIEYFHAAKQGDRVVD